MDRSSLTSIILKAALDLSAERDWYLFPAVITFDEASGKWIKKPLLSKATSDSGLNWGMSKDPDQIRRDFERCRATAIGVPTGEINDHFVIDVDRHGDRDGFASLARLEAEFGELPPTLTARTASDGEHRRYSWPTDGGPEIRNSTSKIAIGIDVRGNGGFAIVPPSGRYSWIERGELIVPAPAPWLEAIRAARRRANGDHPIEFPDGEPDAEVDLDRLALAMTALPNASLAEVDGDVDDPRYFDRDRRLAVLMALHRSFGGDSAGRRIFEAWSEKNSDGVERNIARTWNGLNDNTGPALRSKVREVTARTVYHFANLAAPGWDDDYNAEAERRTADGNVNDDHMMREIAAAYEAEGGSLEAAIAEAAAQANSPEAGSTNSTADAEPAPETKTNGGTPPPSSASSPQPRPPLIPFVPRPAIEIPRRRWLHAAHYLRGNVVMTVAPGGFGKSSLVIANAIEMCLGRGFLGPDPTEADLRVGYWNAEDTPEEVERRIAAFCQHHGIDNAALAGRLFVGRRLQAGRRLVKLSAYGGRAVIDIEAFKVLAAHVRDHRIDVLILDPLIAFHGVSENDNGMMEQVVSEFARISEATGSCLELVHHTRKRQGGADGELTDEDSRGASAIGNAARSVRVLNRLTKDEATLCGITAEERTSYLRFDRQKKNMTPADKATWVRLASVALANGDDVQAIERWSYVAGEGRVDPDLAAWAHEEVGRRSYKAEPRADDWFGRAVATRLGLSLEEEAERKRVRKTLEKLEAMGVLVRDRGRDDDRRRNYTYFRPGPWSRPVEDDVEEVIF